jgi:hypothetical protein
MDPLKAFNEWFKDFKAALQSKERHELLTLINTSVRALFLQQLWIHL